MIKIILGGIGYGGEIFSIIGVTIIIILIIILILFLLHWYTPIFSKKGRYLDEKNKKIRTKYFLIFILAFIIFNFFFSLGLIFFIPILIISFLIFYFSVLRYN